MALTLLPILCVLVASLSSLGLGLDVGMISSTLVQPTFLSYFNNPSSSSIGGIVAAFSAGGFFGAFGCALFADPLGRVWGIRIGAMISIVGIALQAGAVHIGMLIVGRLICGFGAGQLLAAFPVYASEIAPPEIRGALGGFQMAMIEAAIFIATGTGYGFGKNYTTSVQWRGPLAVQAIPLIILLVLTIWLPESPRWLITRGKEDKALKILLRLHKGHSGGEDWVLRERDEIKSQVLIEREIFKPGWKELVTKKSWRKRLILVALLQTFSQLTGINCIQYYTATIYEGLGFSTLGSLRLNLIYGAMGFVFGIFWVCTLDKFSRVRLLVVSSAMMAVALLVQAVLSAVYEKGSATQANPNALRAQVAMFFVFNVFFVSVGMLSWLIPPEMSPMIIRAKVSSVSVAVNNLFGLLVAEVSPIALGAIGFRFFFFFMACNIVAAVFYALFFPETSKLTLEQMDVQFGDQMIEHELFKPEPKSNVDHLENEPSKNASYQIDEA